MLFRSRWEAWWREHRWPRGAPAFLLRDDGSIFRAREHGGALYWSHDGAVYRLRRDGARARLAVVRRGACRLMPFGAKLLARCEDAAPPGEAPLYTIDPAAFTATALVPPARSPGGGDRVPRRPDARHQRRR